MTTTLVIEHQGKTNPLLEGWLAAPTRAVLETLNPICGLINFPPMPANVPDFPNASGVTAGPNVDPDGESWFIDDQSTGPTTGAGGGYHYFISPTFQAQAREKGWILSFTLRVDRAAADWGGRAISIFLNNWLELRHYGLWFGLSGTTTLAWIEGPSQTGIPVTAPSLANAGFHDYVIDYDATSFTASLTVDAGSPQSFAGVTWLSSNLLPRSLVFGSASTGGTGKASFRHVKLVAKN